MEITALDIEWAQAVALFTERGEPGQLVELLRSDKPVPVSARQFIARIFAGELVPPDQRGRGNAKIHWKARKQIEEGLGHVYQNSEIVLCFINELADRLRVEPIDIRQRMEKARRDAIAKLANRYDVSQSSVRKMAPITNASELGRVLSGTDSTEWRGHLWEGLAKMAEESSDHMLEIAERVMRDPEGILDPLLPKDPITE